MNLVLIVLLVLVLLSLPSWPHSRRWGYRPSVSLGTILLVLLILWLLHVI